MIKTDRIVALAIIGVSIFLFMQTGKFVEDDFGSPISATFFPRAILVALMACCALLVITSKMPPVSFPAPKQTAMAALIIVGYVLLIIPVGYFIVTPIFLFILPLSVGYRKWGWLSLLAIGGSVFSYAVFYKVLGVPLPMGLLENIGGL